MRVWNPDLSKNLTPECPVFHSKARPFSKNNTVDVRNPDVRISAFLKIVRFPKRPDFRCFVWNPDKNVWLPAVYVRISDKTSEIRTLCPVFRRLQFQTCPKTGHNCVRFAKPDVRYSDIYCIKCFSLVGFSDKWCPNFGWHLKSEPFGNWTTANCLSTELVWILDIHCTCLLRIRRCEICYSSKIP